MKSRRPKRWVQPCQKRDEIATRCRAQAEGATGSAEVVPIRWRRLGEVRIEVDTAFAPGGRRVGSKPRNVAQSQHRRRPRISLGYRKQYEAAVGEERRAGCMRRVHADVGEEGGHPTMLTLASADRGVAQPGQSIGLQNRGPRGRILPPLPLSCPRSVIGSPYGCDQNNQFALYVR